MAISFLSCKGQTKENTSSTTNLKDPIEVIWEREGQISQKNYSEIGELISTIEFKVKTNNTKDCKTVNKYFMGNQWI